MPKKKKTVRDAATLQPETAGEHRTHTCRYEKVRLGKFSGYWPGRCSDPLKAPSFDSFLPIIGRITLREDGTILANKFI